MSDLVERLRWINDNAAGEAFLPDGWRELAELLPDIIAALDAQPVGLDAAIRAAISRYGIESPSLGHEIERILRANEAQADDDATFQEIARFRAALADPEPPT